MMQYVLLCKVFVLDRLSQCRIEGTGIVGTRTVPVPGSGEPNTQGARTERFRYPSVIV